MFIGMGQYVRWLDHGGTAWKLPLLVYADDAVLLMESEKKLDRTVRHCGDE